MKIPLYNILILGFGFLVGCATLTQGVRVPVNRGAELEDAGVFNDSVSKIVYTNQNWGPRDSLWFYNTSQGSNLIPYDIFKYLEVADEKSSEKFSSARNMDYYRYLVQEKTTDNDDALPVGWVKNKYKGAEYVGLTCAACHTSQLNIGKTGIRIDGGPAMADMEGMLTGLEAALKAVVDAYPNGKKFKNLTENIYGDAFTKEKTERLYAQTQSAHQKIAHYNNYNTPYIDEHKSAKVDYGFARLDAFGRIFNRLLQHVNQDANVPQELELGKNYNLANAPVSYPYLWDTPQHDFVQWNGVADNAATQGLGPLGRNVGEVLGVFGDLDFHYQEDRKGKTKIVYDSSADSLNLARLERHIKKLWSPCWYDLSASEPDYEAITGSCYDKNMHANNENKVLPEIKFKRARNGRTIFEKECQSCHQDIERTDPGRQVVAQFSSLDSVGTDPKMAKNSLNYCGGSGIMVNESMSLCADKADQNITVASLLATSVSKVLTGPIFKELSISHARDRLRTIYSALIGISGNTVESSSKQVDGEPANKDFINAYKARPLNGIWATAPYLHNGSVPTLYDLLLPACSDAEIQVNPEKVNQCRPNQFTVGTRKFNTEKVGFYYSRKKTNSDLFLFDTSIPGNSNKGHIYAAGKLSENEINQLIEYLKTI